MAASFQRIAVIGAGAMGRGIAQLYAQSGHEVVVHDAQPDAVASALRQVRETFGMLAEKGRLGADAAQAAGARLSGADTLDALRGCDLAIEAIVERLDAKRELFARLEQVLDDDAVIVSNTSSLSITALAAACRRPERVAGYHFFNPVPLMKVVEVVAAPRTRADVIDRLVALTRAAGHTPVVAQDTPGFIVNHAGRGFGTEALRIVGEGVTDVASVDRIMREQVSFDGQGFRLGPFELLDLTGLDVSHPVMESIYRQFYEEPRFRPSVMGAQRMAAGLLGRKTREGFYRYDGAAGGLPPEPVAPTLPAGSAPGAWVAPGPRRDALQQLLGELGARVVEGDAPPADALIVVAPLGHDATSACEGLDARRVVAIDTLFAFGARACKRRVLMTTPATEPAWRDAAHALFGADGAKVTMLRDSAGFVAQRIVAMIVAIAAEIAQQRIASPADIDAAVRLGLGYPVGPLTMGDRLGAATVLQVLRNIEAVTGDPRYRPSLWLQRRARLGLSLLHPD